MLSTTSSDTIYISSKQQSESNQTNDDESTSILTDFLNLVPVNPLLEEKLDAGTGPRQEWHVGPEKRVMTIEQEDLPGCGGKVEYTCCLYAPFRLRSNVTLLIDLGGR